MLTVALVGLGLAGLIGGLGTYLLVKFMDAYL